MGLQFLKRHMSKNKDKYFGNNFQKESQMNETNSQENANKTESEELENITSAAPVVEEPISVAKEEVKKEIKQSNKGFKSVYNVELNVNSFVEAMNKSNVVTSEHCGNWRYSLLTTIKSMLNAKDQESFNNEWNTFLTIVLKNKDNAFSENFIFRQPGYWPGSDTEFTVFRRIVYLAINTADIKTRKANLADIRLDIVAEHLNEQQRNNLINFYSR